ncbi:MAG TPA: 4Fe-4S dicluster domain-containing protein [Candidatus Deferrimicrobium sp.]|nr:4Fe-4S dicluster domain-containing protein [Candidatus Deferrimicrobium sp.]
MEILKISKNDFYSFIDRKIAAKESKTIGVVKKGSHYVYAELGAASDLCLDYDVTILPPKKYFQPPKEVLLKYAPKKPETYCAVNECDPITLVGVHYYDLAGIYLMDKAFSEGERDENYMQKRENALLIGMYPTKAQKNRFARSVTKDQGRKVADIMLTEIGDNLVVEILTEKGKKYLDGAKTVKNDYSMQEIEEARNKIKDDQKIPLPVEMIPEYLDKNFDHPVWAHFADKCFSCGSCVMVCPTCYCFDAREEVELSLAEGKRVRVWDGCMLEDFAVVADGHNFRRDKSARFRHRIFRKGKSLPEKYGYFGCVGCGRCANACTADIAGPVKVFNYMEENK